MQPPADRDSHPTASSMATPLAAIRKTLPLRVLSDEDWRHWTTNGYVIVRQAVPASNVERLVDVLSWVRRERPGTGHRVCCTGDHKD